MVKILKRVRECDAQCCRDSPQFPSEDRSTCIYLVKTKCGLMEDSLTPTGICPANPKLTANEAYTKHCVEWPDNMPGRDTGNCCWQWVEE